LIGYLLLLAFAITGGQMLTRHGSGDE